MKDSSFGSAAPKNRSINVGANLLSEWTAEQARLRQEIVRYAAVVGASVVVLILAVPTLLRGAAEGARQNVELKRRVADLDGALKEAEGARKAAQPTLVVGEMCDRTTGSFEQLYNQTDRILRAASSRMALSSMRIDVNGGEAHVVVMAEAEDNGAADDFAKNAGEKGARVDAITSSRPSQLLSEDGITFQYEKRVGVER